MSFAHVRVVGNISGVVGMGGGQVDPTVGLVAGEADEPGAVTVAPPPEVAGAGPVAVHAPAAVNADVTARKTADRTTGQRRADWP